MACYGMLRLWSDLGMRFIPLLHVATKNGTGQGISVVLTGGPCGGKTTLLEELKAAARAAGVDVYTVPEVPSLLISNGAAYPGMVDPAKLLVYEETMTRLQLQVEDAFRVIAASKGRPSLLICDRGVLDIAAYLTADMWSSVLRTCGLTQEALTDRYACVIHLVTAAEGAEEFYTRSNNAARSETAEEARALDRRTLGAWEGHPARHVVGNGPGGFAAKMSEATNIVIDLLQSTLLRDA